MRIHRMLAEPLKYYRLTPPGRVDRRVAELLDLVHLGGRYSDHYPHELSGGQRQRVCIARALALEPQVIICDEPVSALDVSIRGQILNLLKELQDRLGLTYLFISHDLSVVRHMCDRMSVMYLGRIMETGPSEALFQSPVHPYTQALLSAVPADHPAHKRRRVILEGDPPSPADPPPGCVFHTRCPRVRDACRDRPPAMSPTAGDPAHQVACHVFD
jgi:peptide/nickel transport system ATP-binding protein/oligopeptide transport system ATP-binding protein